MANGNETSEKSFSYEPTVQQLEMENKLLRDTVQQLKNQLDMLKSTPLMVCEIKDMLDQEAVIKVPNGNEFVVNVSEDLGVLHAGDFVLVEQRNLNIVRKHSVSQKKFDVEKFVIMEKPTLSWKEIGGLDEQKLEVQEVIELPLTKPKLFKDIGIQPPKGILLHGQPGTGKTLLAKAVANSTNSTFIELVGSELVQKFIGEGAKLVKDLFTLAREKAPTIIFIDEIDAIAAARVELGTSGEREVQRTFMQLLAEIDGFDYLDDVKIIGCTNRIDILDPAITRPGRLDRLIEVGLPDKDAVQEIFKVHTKGMKTGKLTTKTIVEQLEGMSGAEIKSVCTEAGYFAIRENKKKVRQDDFMNAIEKVRRKEAEETPHMFG